MHEVSPASIGALPGRRVALVHEWFSAVGGSEAVFGHIADLLPGAQRFVLWNDLDGKSGEFHESWLARTPLRRSKALALPFMPLAWRTLTRQPFDVVVSSSHAFAHTVKAGPSEHTRYLSYVHSPARYVWSPEFDGRGSGRLLALPRLALQRADLRLSRHVHSYAANSREVQGRIQRFWKRDARVIHPPVDVDYFAAAPAGVQQQDRRYLLGAGRWIDYKNFDLMIEIASTVRLPLVLAGSGPEEVRLRRLAANSSVEVVFEVRPSRERLRELYWGAMALLYPAHEDFGIVPVEAQACGAPVIGLKRGGLLETVIEGETGFLVESLDPAKYAEKLRLLVELDAQAAKVHAANFSAEKFAKRTYEWITQEAG